MRCGHLSHLRKPSIKHHADISSRTRGPNFGTSLHLHPYFVYASSEGSGEYVHMRRLARTFAQSECGVGVGGGALLMFLDT